MAVTKERRRAAFLALGLLASAGGGYLAKDQVIAIGQRYCGPVPTAVIETLDGERLPATPENIAKVNQDGADGATIRMELGKAQGVLARWCDPDRQRLDDTITANLTR